MQLSRSIITTPIGDMLALSSDEGLCALEFTTVEGPKSGQARLTRLNARLARWFPPHEIVDRETPVLARTRAWLAAYFDGTTAEVRNLPLDMRGAPFEMRVWTALTAIPPGQTTSYGAIARALESAGASRAVGAANGANPVSIIVPCHRVIGSTGSLTGYGGGLDRKTWLIDHERRWRTEPQASLF
jgi:methylated-DNA-[protein]-cysteine S-methyltransferase